MWGRLRVAWNLAAAILEIVQNPALWHFSFHGPDAERLPKANSDTLATPKWAGTVSMA
jgi:hypothetical protein